MRVAILTDRKNAKKFPQDSQVFTKNTAEFARGLGFDLIIIEPSTTVTDEQIRGIFRPSIWSASGKILDYRNNRKL